MWNDYLEAVIFDMDGVIVDSEPFWEIAQIEIFSELGIRVTQEETRRTKGTGIYKIAEMKLAGRNIDATPKAVGDAVLARVVSLVKLNAKAMAGVTESVSFFRSRGLKIGLASSSPLALIEVVLQKLGFADLFSCIVSGDEVQYLKPHPMIYLEAARRLEVEPSRCIAIEDSLTGTLAVKSARMLCISVPQTFPCDRKFAIADKVIESLNEIDDSLVQQVCEETCLSPRIIQKLQHKNIS